MNEAGRVVSLVRNAVKPVLMLADADSSDGAKLMYRIRKTYIQSSKLSLIRTHVPLFPDAYLCLKSELTHNPTSKNGTEKLTDFSPKIEVPHLFGASNCVKVVIICVRTLFFARELGMLSAEVFRPLCGQHCWQGA